MDDLISRQAAIDAVRDRMGKGETHIGDTFIECFEMILKALPSAQPLLCGYNIDHLMLIASVLQKENLPPERVAEMLMDTARIIEIVRDEFEETLRKAMVDRYE